jgi:hypothetical protein
MVNLSKDLKEVRDKLSEGITLWAQSTAYMEVLRRLFA